MLQNDYLYTFGARLFRGTSQNLDYIITTCPQHGRLWSYNTSSYICDHAHKGTAISHTIIETLRDGTEHITPMVLFGNHQVKYVPDQDYFGIDTFIYKVNDGEDDSNTATVTINVGAVDDLPVAHNNTYETDEKTSIGIALTATDVDSAVIFSVTSGLNYGNLNLN